MRSCRSMFEHLLRDTVTKMFYYNQLQNRNVRLNCSHLRVNIVLFTLDTALKIADARLYISTSAI